MKIIASNRAKARIINRDTPARYEPNWITARRGKLSLTENSLTFKDWEIPLSSITKAELSKIQSYTQMGYLLTVTTDMDETYQFGLEYDPIWENQTILPVELNEQKIQFSIVSILIRVVIGGLWLWYLFRWLYRTWPLVQRITLNSLVIVGWLTFSVLLLGFNALWARIAVRNNYRYILGGFGSLILYILAGLVTTILSNPPTTNMVGGLTGIFLSLVGSTLGAYIPYRIGAYGDMPIQQFALTTLISILFTPVIGFSFGLFGGSLGILFFCSS